MESCKVLFCNLLGISVSCSTPGLVFATFSLLLPSLPVPSSFSLWELGNEDGKLQPLQAADTTPMNGGESLY